MKATKSGESVCIYTTGPYPANTRDTRYWIFDLDNFIDISWLQFSKRKSEMEKFVSNLLGMLKGKVINVEYLRCDNAGEHMSKLRTLCQIEGIKL